MKKLLQLLFALVVVTAMVPGLAVDAQAAQVLSGTYDQTTLTAGEYTLDGDLSLTAGVTVSGEVTLDLAGHTLSGAVAPYLTVAADSKLTILDSSQDKSGKIDGSTVPAAKATNSLLLVKGAMELRGGNITGYTLCADGKYGNAVCVDDGATLAMYDGARITNNKLGVKADGTGYTSRGGAVGLRYTASFTMYGGELSGNSSQYGGAVASTGSGFAVAVHGGKVTGNRATYTDVSKCGASAFYHGVGTFHMTGGDISGNRTDGTTGAYAVTIFTDGLDFTMTGGTVGLEASGSKATQSIRFKGSDIRISGESQILQPMVLSGCDTKIGGLVGQAKILSPSQLNRGSDQTALETKNADGVYVYTAQPLTYEQGWQQLTEELVSSGTLTSGTYYLKDDVTLPKSVTVSGDVTLYLDGHTLTGAAAPLINVGSSSDTKATLVIDDRAGGFGQIRGITAAREMIMVYGKLTLQEGSLTGHTNTNNTANDRCPGAVKLNRKASFVMNGGAITNNSTVYRGGAILLQAGSSFVMNGGEISGNTAPYGGGIYSIGDRNSSTGAITHGVVELYNGLIRNNTATEAGNAIYVQLTDLKMATTGLSHGVVIEGTGAGYTVHCTASKLTMSGGSVDAERDTSAGSAAIYMTKTGEANGNVTSQATFTGSAVVGGAGFNHTTGSSGAIHNLRRLGKVTSKKALTVDGQDESVGYTQEGSFYQYRYDRPVDLRILSIGNSYSMDALNAIAHVADVFGLNVDAAYLYEGSCTLRRHAYGVANSGFVPYSAADGKNVPKGVLYELYRTDPDTGDIAHQGLYVNVPYALELEEWDIVTLHQGTTTVAFPGTFNSDIDFLSDYLKAAEPNADLYWYMTWSYDPDISPDSSRGPTFAEHFDRDSRGMYNGIVDVINAKIANGGAYEDVFAGWFPVGTAVQNMRELGYDHSMNRDGFHLSYKGGRFLASLTILKTLYPELDLTQLKPEDLFFVDTRSSTAIADPFNVNEDLDLVVQAVNAAVAEAQTGRLNKLTPTTEPTKVETVTDGASVTLAQTGVPFKPQLPSAETLSDGRVVVAAYENAAVAPKSDTSVQTYSGYCFEGYGRIVVWDDSYTQPMLVIDQPQLEAWGISSTAGRYETLLANKSAQYTIFSDPRDPQLTAVTVDADGDGQVDDEMLTLTFWVRDYKNTGTSERGSFLVCSVDGGETWQYAGKTQDGCLVCGDAAVFADGSLLLPCMDGTQLCAVYMTWNADSQCWVEQDHQTVTVPDTSDVDGAYTVDGFALAAPEGDTVYAFVGGNGVVLQSLDRGESWTAVGNQAGLVAKPGLTVVDETRIFATWATTKAPGDTYGKLFELTQGWEDTDAPMLYDATGTQAGKNEAGDPSAALLADGDVLVVSYDGNYRTVLGTAVEVPEKETEEPEKPEGPEVPEVPEDEPVNVEDYKGGETITAPAKNGFVFGGWYADADRSLAYTDSTGSAYVKFVAKDVLSVKYQVTADTNAASELTDLRLVTTVDDLNYREVGFKIYFGDQYAKVSSKTVFSSIVANDSGVSFDYAPSVFHDQSSYFMTFTITRVPQAQFATQVRVIPYWVTLDGTEQEGEALSFAICDTYAENNG